MRHKKRAIKLSDNEDKKRRTAERKPEDNKRSNEETTEKNKMSDISDKDISKFTFGGKHVDWPVWSEKFMARAWKKKYNSILTGDVVVPNDSIVVDESTTIGETQKNLRDLNQNAFIDLVLLIDGTTEAGRVASI